MQKENITLITAIAGVAIGLLGAILGILNTWKAFKRDKVQIRVAVQTCFDEGFETVAVEVINLGIIPIIIKDISLNKIRKICCKKETYPLNFKNRRLLKDCLPERVEPRDSFKAILRPGAAKQIDWSTIKNAAVTTACGLTFDSRDKILIHKNYKFAIPKPRG